MEKLAQCLSSLGIEYFAVLDYKDVIECAGHIRERSGMTPRSAIVFLVPYYTGECKNISRYCASLDYHIILREIGEKIILHLSEEFLGSTSCAFGDHSPISECHAALIAGLGIAGDNGLLINEKYGSYIFIGDVLTDIPPESLGAISKKPIEKCEGCGLCKAACPTGILRGEGSDCLSAITQRKGELTKEEAALMRRHNTAWGCDVCQQSCPHNATPTLTPIEFFYRERVDCLTEKYIKSLSKDALRVRAFGWRGRAVLERNLRILGENDR